MEANRKSGYPFAPPFSASSRPLVESHVGIRRGLQEATAVKLKEWKRRSSLRLRSPFCQNEGSSEVKGGPFLNEMGRVLLSTPREREREKDFEQNMG